MVHGNTGRLGSPCQARPTPYEVAPSPRARYEVPKPRTAQAPYGVGCTTRRGSGPRRGHLERTASTERVAGAGPVSVLATPRWRERGTRAAVGAEDGGSGGGWGGRDGDAGEAAEPPGRTARGSTPPLSTFRADGPPARLREVASPSCPVTCHAGRRPTAGHRGWQPDTAGVPPPSCQRDQELVSVVRDWLQPGETSQSPARGEHPSGKARWRSGVG